MKSFPLSFMLLLEHVPFILESYKAEDFEAVEDRNTRCEMDRDMFQDLLIWAIFCNRRELATLFWSKCPNQLGKDLIKKCNDSILTKLNSSKHKRKQTK